LDTDNEGPVALILDIDIYRFMIGVVVGEVLFDQELNLPLVLIRYDKVDRN